MRENIDHETVLGFGREWGAFTQEAGALSDQDKEETFNSYFAIFPWHLIGRHSIGADIGCGSGRWAQLVAPRVGRLLVCDPSEQALGVARDNLKDIPNVSPHLADIDNIPVDDGTLDFAYCLGVLHHVPDPPRAICTIARKLKPGAPLLVYIYYAFDNRPSWYRALWKATDLARRMISRLPYRSQTIITTIIALSIYWPLARTAALLDRAGKLPSSWPLAHYRDRSLYVMRTDSFDRFCTRLEHRFSRPQIDRMLRQAGFKEVVFSPHQPFWCALAMKVG